MVANSTKYDVELEAKNREAVLLQEEVGLLQRLREIELERGGTAVSGPAKKPYRSPQTLEEVKVNFTNPEGKKRGRPRKEADANAVVAVVAVDPNAPKRGRGRPRKVVDPNAVVAVVDPNAPKRGRGRPRKVVDPNAVAPEKAVNLPNLLETIGATANKPLLLKEFVALAREAGYESKAKDFSNIVYQSLLKLVKQGVFSKNDEDRSYQYVVKQAS